MLRSIQPTDCFLFTVVWLVESLLDVGGAEVRQTEHLTPVNP